MNPNPRETPVRPGFESTYRSPWWLPGGHLQTIYARELASGYSVSYRRQRWQTPDEDFVDMDWLGEAAPVGKILVLFHGLEGCSQRHYVISLMAAARKHGWRGVVPHFRGCSGEANRLIRSYHSGDSREIDWILRRLKNNNPRSEIYAVGVSLGGNMLLKWLGEEGRGASSVVQSAAAVSVPMDLAAAAGQLDFGWKRIIYTRYFMRSLRPKVLAKILTHGLAIDAQAVRACSTFREIDNLYTALFHGFENADDYWQRASSKPWLTKIQVPTLLINAKNDPFLPAAALPTRAEVSDSVILEYPESGGHVGFVSGRWPGKLDWLPGRILDFFAE
jgi:predicted alpha/beta-fold hydrolase